MSALQYLPDDLVVQIGRIAILRGYIESALKSILNSLIDARSGEDIASALSLETTPVEFLDTLIKVAQIRGVTEDLSQQFAKLAEETREDFALAFKVPIGRWTLLAGCPNTYGLYEGEEIRESGTQPRFLQFTVDDLDKLRDRLTLHLDSLEKIMRTIVARREKQAPRQNTTRKKRWRGPVELPNGIMDREQYEFMALLCDLTEQGKLQWSRSRIHTGFVYCLAAEELIVFEVRARDEMTLVDVSAEPGAILCKCRNTNFLWLAGSPQWDIVLRLLRSTPIDDQKIDEFKDRSKISPVEGLASLL